MPEASPSDVREELDTGLENEEITKLLTRVAREIDREYPDDGDIEFVDDAHRRDFEALLVAYRIATRRDRRAESVQTGRTSKEYETSTVSALRDDIRRMDPGNAFSTGRVRRNTDRVINSTGSGS